MDKFPDKNEIANDIIDENDFDKDGKINFKDFLNAMQKDESS